MALREQEKIKRIMKNLKEDNEAKSKECNDALTSLHELKMELMRKSLHVGSLGNFTPLRQFQLHLTKY
jgi:kinesin family member C2/C3